MVYSWKKLNNRSRILVLLLASLVLLNAIVLVTTYNLKSFSGSIASMLNDRLIPSSEIAQIQEYCYKNQLYLEDLVYRNSRSNIAQQIESNNRQLDQVFEDYRNTYFTEEESEHAAQFILALKEYRSYENNIIQLHREGRYEDAEKLFTEESTRTFDAMIRELHLLSGIQLNVGKLLYQSADANIRTIKLVTYTSLVLSLLVAAQLLKVLGIKPH